MAFSLNRAQIIGNVTRQPEVRVAGSQKVATFGVATNFVWTDQTGQKKEKVEFHNVVAWRKLAEICELYLRKGSKVYIEGRIQTRDWEGEDGVKRYRTEIVVDNMIMLDRKGEAPAGFAVPAAVGEQESASASGLEDLPREQKNLKTNGRSVEADTLNKPAASEEDVVIDDLPF